MNKKIFLMTVGGGFVAGVGTALLVSSLCCGAKNIPADVSTATPPQVEMMQHKPHAMKGDMANRDARFNHRHMPDRFARHHEPTPEMKARFAEKLGLTDEQKEQLDKIRQEDMAKMEPLFKKMDDLQAEIRALREANRAHFESILTDEQKEILKTMRPHHHKARKFHHLPQSSESTTATEPTAPVAPNTVPTETPNAVPAETPTAPVAPAEPTETPNAPVAPTAE